MKAVRKKSASLSFQTKNSSSNINKISENDSEYGGAPTPKDFDRFIPWLCLHLGAPRIVTVQRFDQEEYRFQSKRISKTRAKILKESSVKREIKDDEKQPRSAPSYSPTSLTKNINQNAVPIRAYYNPEGLLVEVAFINCSGDIPRRVIRAISTCLAFHPAFSKLTIKGGGLIKSVIDEIGLKLLPYSNITDICLDGNYVADGNYCVVLENVSCLQNLSLRRCQIDDKICKEIANKLEYGAPASKSLASLDVTSNTISDEGAEALGNMLRTNRTLLHFSIADNRLTDKGAVHIFNSLYPFPLTEKEKRDLKLRYLKYCSKKVKIYDECEQEILNRLKRESDKENRPHKSRKPKKTKSPNDAGASHFDKHTLMEQTERLAKEFINDFKDIFDSQNINTIDGQIYSNGNFKMCYLNLAYNNLTYFSVRKLYEVLKYQKSLPKPAQCKGLIKVVLDGNNVPKTCKEMSQIECYLEISMSESISSELKEGKSITKVPKKQSLQFK